MNKTGKSMRRPAKPAPAPKTPMACRLELVRERAAIPSLRGFWQQLADEWEEDAGRVGYEAVRNYHHDREASVSYLSRVAEVFNVNLRWLATGQGAIDQTAEGALAALEQAEDEIELFHEEVADASLDLAIERDMEAYARRVRTESGVMESPLLTSPVVRSAFRAAWARLVESSEDRDLSPEQINAIGRVLLRRLGAPLDEWGGSGNLQEDAWAFEDYSIAMLHALRLAMARPGRGHSIAALPDARTPPQIVGN